MSDNTNSPGSDLYFVVGGLAVLVVGLVLYFGGFVDGPPATQSTTIERTITPDSSSITTTTTTPAP